MKLQILLLVALCATAHATLFTDTFSSSVVPVRYMAGPDIPAVGILYRGISDGPVTIGRFNRLFRQVIIPKPPTDAAMQTGWILVTDPITNPVASPGSFSTQFYARVAATWPTWEGSTAWPVADEGDIVVVQPDNAAAPGTSCFGHIRNVVIPNFPFSHAFTTQASNALISAPRFCLIPESAIAAVVDFDSRLDSVGSPRLNTFRQIRDGRTFFGPVSPQDFVDLPIQFNIAPGP